jgi:hypothetical protein
MPSLKPNKALKGGEASKMIHTYEVIVAKEGRIEFLTLDAYDRFEIVDTVRGAGWDVLAVIE